MKIIGLKAENIKGLKAVDLTPEGDFVEISGKNGAGKSSVLDAIWLALGGKDAAKDVTKALRNGTDSGFVDLDLGSLKVRRTFSENGTTKLTVKAIHDGIESTVGAGQTTLDALRAVALDPAGFISLSPREQRDALLKVIDLGIDLDEWAAERKQIFEDRTDIGRQAKTLGAAPEVDEALPEVEQSASEIIERLREVEAKNRARAAAEQELQQWAEEIDRTTQAISELTQRLEKQTKAHAAAQDELNALPDLQPTVDLETQLSTVEETNAKIRANQNARAVAQRLAALNAEYANKTKALEAHDQKKIDALTNANISLDGLSIGEDGITYDGVPFQDLNSGAQIEVAFWILAELNPRLRIVQIRHGSLLDDDAFEKIKTLAAENDFQIWIETVGTGSENAIIIEAGEVAA